MLITTEWLFINLNTIFRCVMRISKHTELFSKIEFNTFDLFIFKYISGRYRVYLDFKRLCKLVDDISPQKNEPTVFYEHIHWMAYVCMCYRKSAVLATLWFDFGVDLFLNLYWASSGRERVREWVRTSVYAISKWNTVRTKHSDHRWVKV